MDDAPELTYGDDHRYSRDETKYFQRQARADLEAAKRKGFDPKGAGGANVLGAAQLLQQSGKNRVVADYPFAQRMLKRSDFMDVEDQARFAVLSHYGLDKMASLSPLGLRL